MYESLLEDTNLQSIQIIFQPKGTLGFPPDAAFSVFKKKLVAVNNSKLQKISTKSSTIHQEIYRDSPESL
jgi:hypothetical protein